MLVAFHGYLGGVLFGPLLRLGAEGLWVLTDHGADLRDQGGVCVGVHHQLLHSHQHLTDGQAGGPVVLEGVEADATIVVHVGVEDLGRERHLWGLEGVLCGEDNIQEEVAAFVRATLRPHDGATPIEHVGVAHRSSLDSLNGILHEVLALLQQSSHSHGGKGLKFGLRFENWKIEKRDTK